MVLFASVEISIQKYTFVKCFISFIKFRDGNKNLFITFKIILHFDRAHNYIKTLRCYLTPL